MDHPPPIPHLITFYFGDSASTAHAAASPRLKKWSRAFDQWLVVRRQDFPEDTVKHAILAWRRLVRQSGKMPWRLTTLDLQGHLAWLQQQGFALPTINSSVGFFSSFFAWCSAERIDPACPAGFNPARDVSRIPLKRYHAVSMWSHAEVDSFLGLLGRDTSPIGRRDAAFFLCRLNLGVPLRSLQQLRWEQIEQAQPDVWVRWSQSGHRLLLPPHLWGAIQAYLQVSGRCSGMCPGKYIFAPQVQPVLPGSGACPGDWLEMHYLSDSSLQRVLKLYGRQLGISDDRLTLSAMRRTAIRLQLDKGADLDAMRSFLDTREKIKSTRYRLARFPLLPSGDPSDAQDNPPLVQLPPVPLPPRTSTPLKGDEGFIHGYYSRHKDRRAVEAIMAEAITGLDQEIACLKRMLRHVLELQGDEIRKAEVYIESARRLGELVVAARQAQDQPADTWADEFLSCLDAIDPDPGAPPLSQRIKLQVLGLSPDQPGSSPGLGEEVATIRLILRNINARLEQGVPAHEYLCLVDLYSHGCLRLLRLLKLDGGDYSGRLERYVRAHINEAISRLQQEYAEQRANLPSHVKDD